MSYCVHCGVELDATASFCPLCHTRVLDPGQPVDTASPKPFPTRRGEVAPAAKQEVALLITAMLASVAVCCGVLNLFLRADRMWSLYVIGASAMLWLWLVPPLLARGMHLLLRLLLDVAAVAPAVVPVKRSSSLTAATSTPASTHWLRNWPRWKSAGARAGNPAPRLECRWSASWATPTWANPA